MKLSPSIIATDYKDENNLKEVLKQIESTSVDRLHLDVMDGVFVKNKTFDYVFVNHIKKLTNLKLDVHLMARIDEDTIIRYIDAGADVLTIHFETLFDIKKASLIVRERSKQFGISINPNTDIKEIEEYILNSTIDQLLIMSVEPGKCGQEFIESCLDKIKYARKLSKNLVIEVDGGINLGNISKIKKAGADVVVSGSSLFNSNNLVDAIKKFTI